MDNFSISSLPIEQLYIELQSSADGLTAEQASKRNRERLKSDKQLCFFVKEALSGTSPIIFSTG
ncbi:MAG TPA: cation-transporting P-type ATPase, partial [Ruminiclostridium sp.]|nr:cation-transporting P-type ATPase [Ruminiclostridium sp.]